MSNEAPMAWNVGDALAFGWRRFRNAPRSYLLGQLALLAGLLVATALGAFLQATFNDLDAGIGTTLFVGAICLALVVVAVQVLGAGILREALGVTEGRPFRARAVLSTEGLAPVVLTSLLVAGGTFVGSLLCYLPGLAFAFLAQWSLYVVLDQGVGPLAAVRASVDLVRSHLTESLVWFLISGLVVAAGAAACGLGLLAALPVVVLGGAYTYRTLTGQPVVE